jgi:hypothetical protein
VTLAIRSEASIVTSVATSSGVENRPVAIADAAVSRIVSASTLTYPGETQLIRIPRGPNSWDSDLLRFTTAALAAP